MATITNAIRTVFSAQGAGDVEDATNRVGRAQTRLGQASASSGRSFAAQSQGLGGLVAAYAGAAATIFAITEAFNALNKAAQAETIIRGTNTLAAEVGQSGPRILRSVQEITQGQLTLAESAENVNIALAAGFNTDQIENLTTIATKASRALGRDLTESIQRVTRGAAKLEPELLDELGIFTRIDPAVRAYANSLNVSEASLTNFERRQAFVNAVIEEGNKKFSSIDTAAPSAQKSLEQLRAQVTELGTEFLQFVNRAIGPLVDFFKNNAGNTLLLFGGILSLVLGKGISLVKEWASTNIQGLSKFAAKLAQVAEITKGNFQTITDAATAAKEAIATRGGLAGTAAGLQATGLSAADAQQLAGTGNFATQLRGQGSRLLSQEAAAARQRFLAGGAAVGAQRDADVKIFERAIANLTAAGKQNTLAFRDANAALTAYNAANAKAAISTRLLTGASAALSVAARGAAFAFSALNIALGAITTLAVATQLIGQIFGVDPFAGFKKSLDESFEKTERLKAGLLGLTVAANDTGESIDQALRRAGASTEQIEKSGDRILEIFSTVKDVKALIRIDIQADEAQKTLESIIGGIALGAGAGPMLAASAEQQAETLARSLTELEKRNIQLEKLDEALVSLRTELSNVNSADTTRISQLKQEIILYERVREAIEDYGTGIALLIGSISALTGLDTSAVATTFDSATGAVSRFNGMIQDSRSGAQIATISEKISFLGFVLKPLSDGTYSLDGLTEDQIKLIENATLLESTLQGANEEFKRGATDSERLSAKLAGANTALENAIKTGTATADAIAEARLEIEALSEKVRDLKQLESILEGIRKAFSGQIAAVEAAPFSGFISATGQIAKNAEEAKANQLAYLGAIIKSTDSIVVLSDAGIRITAEQQKQVELNQTARKALTGQLLQNLQAVQKIKQAEEERTIQLQQQLQLLKLQNTVAIAQAANTIKATVRSNQISAAERDAEFARVSLEFDKGRDSLAAQREIRTNTIANLEKEIALAQTSGAGSQAAANKQRLDAVKGELQLLRAQRAVTLAERDPAASQKDIINARREVILLEQRLAEQDYKNRIAVIKAQGGVDKAAIEFEQSKIDQELSLLAREEAVIQDNQRRERELFDAETANITRKIKADIEAIENQKKVIEAQKQLDLAKIQQDQDNAARQSQLLIDELKGYKTFADSVTALIGGIEAFAVAVAEILGFSGIDTADLRAKIAALPKDIITDIDSVIATANANIGTQNTLYEAQKGQIRTIAALTATNLSAQQLGLKDQLTDAEALRAKQREILQTDLTNRREELANKIEALRRERELIALRGQAGGADIAAQLAQAEAEYAIVTENLKFSLEDLAFETDTFRQALLGVKEAFRNTLTEELVNLNKSLFDASDSTKSFGERLRESVGNVFRSVQEQFFRKTIAEPVSNFITDTVFGLFGLGGERGIEAAKVDPDGALRVRLADGNILGGDVAKALTGEGQGGFLSNLFTGVSDFFSGLFGKNGVVANLFSGIFGSGGLFSSIFTGFGSIFSGLFGGVGSIFGSIFKGIFGLFAMAQGGMVHMASGGQLRDRVPALLEPGEFVIRKPMAREIGTPALQAMNATGQMPVSAPVINFKNEGTAKSVQAEQPRFDGEKYVVDIITRDLANNGPIRRTLRSGNL